MAIDPKERGPLVPSDKTADRIASLYKAVDEAIANEINIAIASGTLDQADYLRERQAAIRALLQAAESQSAAATAIEIRNSYAASATAAVEILRRAGVEIIKEAFDDSDRKRIELLVENSTVKFNDITQLVGRRTDDIFRQVSIEQVTAGQGLTRRELSASLERAFNRAGVTRTGNGGIRLINVGGRNLQLSKYAELIARTTPREAATYATISRVIENKRDLVTVSAHKNSCPICSPYDGNTYSLSGQDPKYPQLDRLVPFHPNCRHVLTPAAIF